ncbi:MAG: hypothetical protein A2Y12_06150 [Planctomycetes bacterium GWF2_42_9]|nr:MAG: hypothetical protein A2Y12_06150 [Planctomycetes bacterium GWF2_42_9]HAL45687.1 hypothetical protein [Phycisphaerales bacterium]
MELVNKTSTALAITDELTTLLDWTNIEQVSGFTIIVENAGGGTGSNITDVQIDTSNDGGINESLDAFSSLYAAAIASGASKKEGFTSSAKFVRVRAICSTGDTTASCWLLADSTLGRICTLADIKDRLGISTTEDDTLISRIITGLESLFNNHTNRKLLLNAADETFNTAGNGPRIILPRYPIVSITSIKEAIDYDFANADALTANEDYRLIADKGTLYRLSHQYWPAAEDSIEIKYRGGYVSAGQTPATGETAMPADLREAAIEQASFIYKRRNDIGITSNSSMGSSITTFSAMDLLPMVKEILKPYNRLIL